MAAVQPAATTPKTRARMFSGTRSNSDVSMIALSGPDANPDSALVATISHNGACSARAAKRGMPQTV